MGATRSGLIRVVYFSRNRMTKSVREMKREVDSILQVSQVNNRRRGVTGALVFNQGMFGQVLEGKTAAVEETFEIIQSDERHFDVTVLQISSIEAPSFENWAMGFVGDEKCAAQVFGVAPEFRIRESSGIEAFHLLRELAYRNELTERAF